MGNSCTIKGQQVKKPAGCAAGLNDETSHVWVCLCHPIWRRCLS